MRDQLGFSISHRMAPNNASTPSRSAPGLSLSAIHQSGHFIGYLNNKKKANQIPTLWNLRLDGNRWPDSVPKTEVSVLEFRSQTGPGGLSLRDMITGVEVIDHLYREIKYLLSGYAAEWLYLQPYEDDVQRLRFLEDKYRREVEGLAAHEDLLKAVRLSWNHWITSDQSLLHLNPIFKDAILDLKSFWHEVTRVARLLEEHRELDHQQMAALISTMDPALQPPYRVWSSM